MPASASVALLSSGIDKPLSYVVPDALQAKVVCGVVVAVPLQKRLVTGVVVDLGMTDDPAGLKPIHAVLDAVPAFNAEQLNLARWISQEYVAPLGRCCALMVPPGFTAKSAYMYALAENAKLQPHDDVRKRLLDVLKRRGPLTEGKLAAQMRGSVGWRPTLAAWVKAGAVLKTSTLQPPKVQPQRGTLAQLVLSDQTLEVVVDKLQHSKRLQPQTRARRVNALRYLHAHSGLAWVDWVAAETGATRIDLTWLADQGYVLLGDSTRWRDPLSDIDYVVKTAPPLTEDQARAWAAIESTLAPLTPLDEATLAGRVETNGLESASRSAKQAGDRKTQFGQFLLRGVTGSGKTEVYMRAVERVLAQGKSAIVLVPEISLTPQTARRFLERFPGQVALVHSKLKPGERFDTWRRIRAGELRLVVGARSALFAPVQRLGLIVLDEEHDPSYKQTTLPWYDARRVAMHYAGLIGATLIFGSATPSLEALDMAGAGSSARAPNAPRPVSGPFLTFLELPNRVRGHVERIEAQSARIGVTAVQKPETDTVAFQPLPSVRVIDMRAELRGGNTSMFSGALHTALGETLRRGEQAILFLNRRGTASSVICRDCGLALRCPNDEAPLTLHREGATGQPSLGAHLRLKCHQCDHEEPLPAVCPSCGSSRIRQIGIGTQRVETAILEQFPSARVVRWDRDSATRSSADMMLGRFTNRQADVLIGTQMIAKGLDLPLVTLVGVILADVGLFLPDFRASERVFNLIEQVAGRAGRGLLSGRVIVQTYNPEHPAIEFARKHDVQGFARYELAQRRALRLPPFTRLVRFEIAHESSDEARKVSMTLAKQLRKKLPEPSAVLGPSPAYFTRRNKLYRWQVLARTQLPGDLLDGIDVPRGVIVDVDPISVL